MLRKLRKYGFCLIVLAAAVLLSGCGVIRERIAEELWKRSGVPEDAEYLQYRELEDSSRLDDEGRYHDEALDHLLQEASQEPEAPVHVSFAFNDQLRFTYYRDEQQTEMLPTENCRLEPGDAIYASEPKIMNPKSLLYQFDAFQVREYDGNGRIKRTLTEVHSAPGLVFRIPEDFTGTELAVIPLGSYRSRTVRLNAVQRLSDGTERVLENGIWDINGKKYGNTLVELNPMESYRVVYDYSAYKDGWYLEGSVPEAYWDRSGDGTITFLAVPSNEAHVDYKVALHPYGSMKIHNAVSFQNPVDSFLDSASTIFGNKSIIETQNIIDAVHINGIPVINNFSDTEILLPDLKVGDEVMVRLPAALKLHADFMDLHSEATGAYRVYRFAVPDREDMAFSASVSYRNSDPDGIYFERTVPNGSLTLLDVQGIRYLDGSELPAEGEKVTVVITPDADKCIYGRNVKDNVYCADMSFSDFENNFAEILSAHPIKPGIMVTLDTADELGECVFWTGSEQISGQVMLREGQDLQFDYMLRTDSGYEIILSPEDRGLDLNVWSPYAANRALDVTDELDGQTLRCRDLLTLKEGVQTDVIEDPF